MSCFNHLQSDLVFPLLFTYLCSRAGGVLSHQNSSTPRCPHYSLGNLGFLAMLSVSFFVFGASETAFYYNLIPSELENLRTLYAAPGSIRLRTLPISFCAVDLRTFFATRSSPTPFFKYNLKFIPSCKVA